VRTRSIGVVAVVGVLAFVLGPSPVLPADDPNGAQLTGIWVATVYLPNGEPLIQQLENFTKEGHVTILLPFGPGIPFDETRVGCMGEWRRAAGRTFDVTMYCLWRQKPDLQPDRISFKLTLDKDGDHLSGPFTYFYNDPEHNGPSEVTGFTLEATRLGLVPLE
jgi:hypothetical protein